MNPKRSKPIFSRLSIQQRLPLLICFFLLFTIIVYGFLNYYSLKKATLMIGRERVNTLTEQISSMLGQSALATIKYLHNTAYMDQVSQYLATGGKQYGRETVDELNKLHKDSTWMIAELADSTLKTVLRSDKSLANVPVSLKEVLTYTHIGPDSAWAGKFYYVKGTTYYPIIASVTRKKHIIGYLVCWKILPASQKAVDQLSQLMGSGANLYIGNRDGGFWTNTIKPVSGLNFNAKIASGPFTFRDADGQTMLAAVQPVAYTDWLTVIGFPEKNLLSGMNGFMRWIFLFGIILLGIGAFAAWLTSRGITGPLNKLTGAAMAISAGDYSSHVSVDMERGDELGKLAHAFNIMEQYVQQTYEELEAMVDERTSALSEEIRLRETTEASLRESRQRYHLMINEVKDYAIIMLDAEGKILVWNQGAERIKGYTEKEILGKSFSLFYTPSDIENQKPQHLLKRAAKEGRVEDVGWRVRKDGSKFWADVVLTPIYNYGELTGFAKVTRDITERKKLEDEVAVRTAQLEASNKELEAFSYSVSHDLRTPLRAVSGYSVMLKEDYEEKLDAEGLRIINNIIINARIMGTLIDELLAFSRLGKKELTLTNVNMQQLAGLVTSELLHNETDGKYRVSIGALPVATADQAMIKQVLMNLVSNALKYSSKQADPVIEIGGSEDENETIYYVKDNGVGFDMAYAGKLFGVFQRLHSQDEFEGTGVGLALVKRIIDKHSGKVWAEAEEDKGAKFYFSLPKNNKQ
ncbi:MAG: PAS domain S-box protein [Bacteroidetes bacterium]|nr:PAS domain S-box protein [Bacteroidota bacterium]